MESILVSIPEAGKALGIGRTKAYQLIEAGKLESVCIGRRRLVKVESVKALAESLVGSMADA